MSSGEAAWFSQDYATARARFRDAARHAGARLWDLPLEHPAPDGSTLTIDIARLGPEQPERAVVHSSGLHGVEGFAGSAIQLALLAEPPPVPEGGALILVHALNPYGMAWLRRCNKNNVDLNRNFDDVRPRRGAPQSYALLDGFLNPASPPGLDFFYLRAAYYLARYGLEPLKQAIAGGQYEYPNGLFFGGKALERGPVLYRRWLEENLCAVSGLYALDVHTGLGRFAHDSLVAHQSSEDLGELEGILDRPIARDVDTASVTYAYRGGYARAFDGIVPEGSACVITQEFGTYRSVRVLRALREENRAHHHAGGAASHPAKHHLREMFAPRSNRWRARVVHAGRLLADALMTVAFRERDGDRHA